MYGRPLLLVPLLPVVVFTWWVARQYLHVSRELKRLESLKKSPVFVLFSETLQVLKGCTVSYSNGSLGPSTRVE